MRPLRSLTAAAAWAAWPARGGAEPSTPLALPFEYSKDFDLYNQGEAVKRYEDLFYNEGHGALRDDRLREVDELRRRAFSEPVLALAAAQVLYMFGWFRSTGQIIRENIAASAQLFERSIAASNCFSDAPEWNENACDIRWMHSMLLYNWLAETEPDPAQSQSYLARAYQMLQGLREAPRYAAVAATWISPQHVSLNAVRFPDKPSHAVWPLESLPMGRFLEENHHVFKEELEAIVNDPGDIYTQLMQADPSREHLSSPGGWDTIRIVRYHNWYDLFCSLAPRTCELIASRPEIAKCNFMNVNYVKLHPGAHLKPHFGNGPRLSAHLSVIAPEPLRAGMSVGTEKVLWVEGKAILFDDTYIHAVSHWGKLPRYVMLVWFCHPCDDGNEHGQTCPSK